MAAFADDVVVRVRVDDDMRVLRPAVDVPVDVGVLVRVGAQKRVVDDEGGARRHHEQGNAEPRRWPLAEEDLSPANVRHLAAQATPAERALVRRRLDGGRGGERLPFDLFGWIPCIADTAGDWLFSDVLDNVHPEPDGDFSQVSRIRVPGGLLIGSLDVFAGGEPVAFLRNLAAHFPDPARNRIVIIPGTGHTYQGKAAQTAREIAELVRRWRVGTPERRAGLAATVPSW